MRLIDGLAPGDHLVATRMDRLARSTRDLLNTTDAITKAGATLEILDNPLINTSGPYGKLLTTLLGAVAEFERSLILSRTKEGRVRAKANGIKFGRKPTLTPYQMSEARKRRSQAESLTSIARTFGVAHSTIGRVVNDR